jgi:hypothetical protein
MSFPVACLHYPKSKAVLLSTSDFIEGRSYGYPGYRTLYNVWGSGRVCIFRWSSRNLLRKSVSVARCVRINITFSFCVSCTLCSSKYYLYLWKLVNDDIEFWGYVFGALPRPLGFKKRFLLQVLYFILKRFIGSVNVAAFLSIL